MIRVSITYGDLMVEADFESDHYSPDVVEDMTTRTSHRRCCHPPAPGANAAMSAWGGRRVTEARKRIAQLLPMPCAACGLTRHRRHGLGHRPHHRPPTSPPT